MNKTEIYTYMHTYETLKPKGNKRPRILKEVKGKLAKKPKIGNKLTQAEAPKSVNPDRNPNERRPKRTKQQTDPETLKAVNPNERRSNPESKRAQSLTKGRGPQSPKRSKPRPKP